MNQTPMFVLLDYAGDIIHALKVGVFSVMAGIFLTLVTVVVQAIRDENENNQ